MRHKNREEWGIEVCKKLMDLKMMKKTLAEMLGMNRQHLCNILNGNTINSKHKTRIIKLVDELWSKKEDEPC
jgi:plasmid maintenance system antidote protein VapI